MKRWMFDVSDIFPQMRSLGVTSMAATAMQVIAAHARELGLMPLERNHARFFCQPMGFVSYGVDLDLVTGALNCYPGRYGKPVSKRASDAKNFATAKRLLHCDAFKFLPETNSKEGCDGASYFIEVDMDGAYSWRCHWVPEEKVLRSLAAVFDALSRDVAL